MPVRFIDIVFGAAAALAVPLFMVATSDVASLADTAVTGPLSPSVEIPAGSLEYRLPGEFLRAGRPANGPIVRVAFDRPFSMMRHQVSAAEYARCVEAGACLKADEDEHAAAAGLPMTGVSYIDATSYAAWYTRETGMVWRLPTAAEWAHAAAERFAGESIPAVADDPANPAVAWIRAYREASARTADVEPGARQQGHFGPNTRGVVDLAGNVWEWTSTCYSRETMGEGDARLHAVENCRVHVVEGRHRAYMSDFIRDGVSGGCAVGTPPANLGIRLVHQPGEAPGMIARLIGWLALGD